ncbi:MAG: tyrosine-type recombinase/integrase [Clostridia bacterium]|nr:tyrosine-type recombinase/integrase [Clostridia bacterium]
MERMITDRDQIQAFASYLKENEKSAATVEKYLRDVRAFYAYVGDREIDKQAVLDYKAYLGKHYAVASANSMIAALNAFLRFCGAGELVIKRFALQRQIFCEEQKELTRDEYYQLIAAANQRKNERLSLILQTICGTGIRVSELQYITVEAVQRGEATVNCKGKNRRILIVSALRKKLVRYAKTQKIHAGSIFVTGSGKPVSRNQVWRQMKSLCKQADVLPSKVFPHNLRHLFARIFYNMEKDIAKLADILGHASIDTTRIYIITTGTEHLKKMQKMHLIL